jgi:hypothetical protein
MTAGKGIISAGAGLLWRRQRVLWWLFAANLVVGLLAATPVRNQLRNLDNSIAASDSLYHQMNYFRLREAMARPEGIPNAFYGGSTLLVLVYFAFLLFAMGGVLEALSSDRTLPLSEFLRASAEYFWRMVRLLLVFAVLTAPLAIAQSYLGDLADWLSNRSDWEQLGFWVILGFTVILALIGLTIRVWIDVAQLDAVAQDQPAVRRSLRHARRLFRGHFGHVYGAVLGIQSFLFLITLGLFFLWVRLPHEAIASTFFIEELTVLLWLAFRLWQKAVETAWYQQRVLSDIQPPAEIPAETLSVSESSPTAIPSEI